MSVVVLSTKYALPLTVLLAIVSSLILALSLVFTSDRHMGLRQARLGGRATPQRWKAVAPSAARLATSPSSRVRRRAPWQPQAAAPSQPWPPLVAVPFPTKDWVAVDCL